MDLFYSKFNANTKLITINETDSKHITKSFRKNIGDLIRITNGKGLLCEAEILEKGKNIKVKVVSNSAGNPEHVNQAAFNSKWTEQVCNEWKGNHEAQPLN